MKVVTIIGARPQFVKAAVVSRELRRKHTEVLVHTGQHYDDNMSKIFFQELEIPEPNVNLCVGSGSHATQTAGMLIQIEEVLQAEEPDWMLVYGDTNSTLAGALAATKLQVRVAHVEAGLRSFDRAMPEEINRVLTDHVSNLLFCPTQTAVNNLAAEGIRRGVYLVGDVMMENLAYAVEQANRRSSILRNLGLSKGDYLLSTVHRAENTNNALRLKNILTAFDHVGETVIFPVHPRTRKAIQMLDYKIGPTVRLIEPVGYLDMILLEQSARMILTDSGGIQKEAYWLGVPCVTLRDETEWVETVQAGWNILAGAVTARVIHAVHSFVPPSERPSIYSEDGIAKRIVRIMDEERALSTKCSNT